MIIRQIIIVQFTSIRYCQMTQRLIHYQKHDFKTSQFFQTQFFKVT
jgi:hypothetical protein